MPSVQQILPISLFHMISLLCKVDTYGLCVIVHMMLHGSYMTIEKKVNPDGSYHYGPKLPFKRYWLILFLSTNATVARQCSSNQGLTMSSCYKQRTSNGLIILVFRYWNSDLWKPLFSQLLNMRSNGSDVQLLRSLRESFESYLHDNPNLIKTLKHSLAKQKACLCSAQLNTFICIIG